MQMGLRLYSVVVVVAVCSVVFIQVKIFSHSNRASEPDLSLQGGNGPIRIRDCG